MWWPWWRRRKPARQAVDIPQCTADESPVEWLQLREPTHLRNYSPAWTGPTAHYPNPGRTEQETPEHNWRWWT